MSEDTVDFTVMNNAWVEVKARHILNFFSLSGGFSGGRNVCSRCVCGRRVGRC